MVLVALVIIDENLFGLIEQLHLDISCLTSCLTRVVWMLFESSFAPSCNDLLLSSPMIVHTEHLIKLHATGKWQRRGDIGGNTAVARTSIINWSGAMDETIHNIRSNGDITIFKSVGIGLQDTAIAGLVLEKAEEMGVGTRLDLL